MSGVKNLAQGISSINRFRSAMRELPLRIRSAVAKDAEAILTRAVQGDFDGGKTVYGDARPTSKDPAHPGAALTLKKSGATRSALAFVAVGTIVRVQLGTRWAKYLVGKYKILPQTLPASWRTELEKLVREYREDFEREAAR